MKWSLNIGSFRGIPVRIHTTFLLILAWVAFSYLRQGHSLSVAAAGVGFVVAIFLCVVLHEFGHALVAQKYGIRTRDITLLPIGGVARIERMPDDPRQELWLAAAGPSVNIAIAAVLFIILNATTALVPMSKLTVTTGPFVQRLLLVNLFLAGFNLLPAFPMDGGRVVRALLAMRMDYARATHVAASLGQGMALLFGFLGAFFNPFLIFIALFVWIGAAQESSVTSLRTLFNDVPVSSAMLTDFRTLHPDDTLQRAVDLILAGYQQDFPVVVDGSVVGILSRTDLMSALAEHGQDYPVAQAMSKEFEVVESSDMLQNAMAKLQGCKCHIMPVLKAGTLRGLLAPENIAEFMMIHAALEKAVSRAR
ncbi:MAG: site-2 protease family protein [bacterium]|jgi:Zn-dependent protease|nr:site-2 protease family protein [candidate division KSB1 bacterium]MDH7558910.1 site-2 protease family protein [bacterium]